VTSCTMLSARPLGMSQSHCSATAYTPSSTSPDADSTSQMPRLVACADARDGPLTCRCGGVCAVASHAAGRAPKTILTTGARPVGALGPLFESVAHPDRRRDTVTRAPTDPARFNAIRVAEHLPPHTRRSTCAACVTGEWHEPSAAHRPCQGETHASCCLGLVASIAVGVGTPRVPHTRVYIPSLLTGLTQRMAGARTLTLRLYRTSTQRRLLGWDWANDRRGTMRRRRSPS
jgi:hypothetical protein